MNKGSKVTLGGLVAVGGLAYTIYHTEKDDDEKHAAAVIASHSCRITGHLLDSRSNEHQPLALNILIADSKGAIRVKILSGRDGHFSWGPGDCEDLDRSPIRVSLGQPGQGCCVAQTGHVVDASSNSDQEIYFDPSVLRCQGAGSTGDCPSATLPSGPSEEQ